MNSVLTVRAHQTGSHRNRGWETFTDAVIKKLSDERENLVFMLWGSYAKAKISLIDTSQHLVLTTVHPSPRSAEYGFFGCKHFSKANDFLRGKKASRKSIGKYKINLNQSHMDIQTFINNYYEAFSLKAELPIAFWYSDSLLGELKQTQGCLFKALPLLGKARLSV